MGGRRLDGRPAADHPSAPRLPQRVGVGVGTDLPAASAPVTVPGRAVRPSARQARSTGPLVAAPAPPPRLHGDDTGPPGRLRGFIRRHGWRAYAVPLLAAATVATLVDLSLTTPAESAGTGAASPSVSASAPALVTPEALPSAPPRVSPGPTEKAIIDAAPSTTAPAPVAEDYVENGAGSVTVVDGGSAVLGAGPLQRFAVEIEDGIEVDGVAFADAVAATLGDPRSWGAGGRVSFQRVGRAAVAAGDYDFKVSLISPGSMERYCPGVGTNGYTSCRYQERAVINLARWATAVPHYGGDVATYREYVVNHEVGHILGNGHVSCPGAGQPAPVMQQQTLGLQGCARNAWPYP